MSNVVEMKLGKWSKKKVLVPNAGSCMEAESGKSLFWFGCYKENKETGIYRKFFGVGKVYRVAHSEKFDLVYMQFGVDEALTVVLVYENRARRQTLTLKRGQYADVYGFGCYNLFKVKGGKKVRFWRYFGLALKPWYVPTQIDIKRNDLEKDIEKTTENENEIYNGDEILEMFKGIM